MDSGENMSEVQSETVQPVDGVVPETETTEATPQAEATEETELYIEDEGDQQEEPKKEMSEDQNKAARIQERKKRKAKEKENQALRDKLEEQQRQIEELRINQAKASRGEIPDRHDFDTQGEFLDALDKWRSVGSEPKQAKEPVQSNPTFELDDDQYDHLYESERKIKKSFSDYEDNKKVLFAELEKNGVNPEAGLNEIAAVCHANNLDPAKVVIAAGKFPSEVKKLIKAAGTNILSFKTALSKLESKVKSRSKVNIDTKPEPNLKSTGSVDHTEAKVKKLLETYSLSGDINDFRAYLKAKKGVKGK